MKYRELIDKMTLEEKAGLTSGMDFWHTKPIPRLGIPSMLLSDGPHGLRKQEWQSDHLGMHKSVPATCFPTAASLANSWDTDMIERLGRALGLEAASEGISVLLGPGCNIKRNPLCGRNFEYFSEDPYLSGKSAAALIRGVQSNGISACVKHFAANSQELRRMSNDSVVDERTLREIYLPSFEMAVKEGGVKCVMTSYNRLNGEYTNENTHLLQDILCGEWGYDGMVVTDWGGNNDRVKALVAGDNLEMPYSGGDTDRYVAQAVRDGVISEELLDERVDKILDMIFTTRKAFDYKHYDKAEHHRLAAGFAEETAVLLKNDGILPLDKAKIKTIGVIGPNANDRMALIGNYHGTASRYITVLEGIQDYVGDDVRVLYAEGCHLCKDRVEGLGLPGDRLSEAETVAEHSDVVVLVTGLNENLEGEEMDQSNSVGSGDKANLLLPAPQRKLMEVVAKTGKPVILINMTGSAMDLRFAEESFSAVVQGWYPGARGGKAIAELLFGKYSFSGKLPVTFYNDSDELPAFTDYAMENRTYRYFTGGVLYPFGYGLTYGKTEVTKAEMRDDGEHYTITATVKNEGCAVHEILQVYVRDNESKFAVRNHSLCAFKAVSLGANETCDVEITVPKTALEIVDDTGTRRVDSRSFTFFVGTSQPDDRSAELLGTRPVAVELKL